MKTVPYVLMIFCRKHGIQVSVEITTVDFPADEVAQTTDREIYEHAFRAVEVARKFNSAVIGQLNPVLVIGKGSLNLPQSAADHYRECLDAAGEYRVIDVSGWELPVAATQEEIRHAN